MSKQRKSNVKIDLTDEWEPKASKSTEKLVVPPPPGRKRKPSTDSPVKPKKKRVEIIELSSDDEPPSTAQSQPAQSQSGITLSAIMQSHSKVMVKPKEKIEDTLWVDDPFPPQELAVHSKKVEAVSDWILQGLPRGQQYGKPRILMLTGASGAGKTATIRTLCDRYKIGIMEWINPIVIKSDQVPTISLSQTFTDFVLNNSRMGFGNGVLDEEGFQHRLILIEDLPNIASSPLLRKNFYDTILAYSRLVRTRVPLVLIVSDVGGSIEDDWVMTERMVLPLDLRGKIGHTLSIIHFNPVAHTILMKALKSMVSRHRIKIGEVELEVVASRSSGDLRCAINALQFFSLQRASNVPMSKPKGVMKERLKEMDKLISPHVAIGRENTMPLFHALGKILYNKREGEDAKPLPLHLEKYHRPKKVDFDVDKVVEDTYLPPSTILGFLFQNYPTFFQDIEEVETAVDYMSQADLFLSPEVARYGSMLTSQGLLFAHTNPIPPAPSEYAGKNGQRVMTKPKEWSIIKDARRMKDSLMFARNRWTSLVNVYPNVDSWMLDYIPFLGHLSPPSFLEPLIRGFSSFTTYHQILRQNAEGLDENVYAQDLQEEVEKIEEKLVMAMEDVKILPEIPEDDIIDD